MSSDGVCVSTCVVYGTVTILSVEYIFVNSANKIKPKTLTDLYAPIYDRPTTLVLTTGAVDRISIGFRQDPTGFVQVWRSTMT